MPGQKKQQRRRPYQRISLLLRTLLLRSLATWLPEPPVLRSYVAQRSEAEAKRSPALGRRRARSVRVLRCPPSDNCVQAGKQASKQAGKQASRQAIKQASRQAGKQPLVVRVGEAELVHGGGQRSQDLAAQRVVVRSGAPLASLPLRPPFPVPPSPLPLPRGSPHHSVGGASSRKSASSDAGVGTASESASSEEDVGTLPSEASARKRRAVLARACFPSRSRLHRGCLLLLRCPSSVVRSTRVGHAHFYR